VRDPILALVHEARHALVYNQGDFAKLYRVSRRTIQRWEGAGKRPDAGELALLARAVFPRSESLAARIAQAAGTTLQDLGLAPPPLPAPPPTPPFAPSLAHLVDSITCAAADAMKLSPDTVRPALLAAFARARDLRLEPEDVAKALAGPEEKKPRRGSVAR
jgi:transcriptional regulator with XRE-family HTH domain